MANRDRDFYDDRDTFYTTGTGARRGGASSEAGVYERFQETRRDDGPLRSRVQVHERERERDDDSRLPSFMREEIRRGPSAPPPATSGTLVLRQREVETVSRPRARSPSQVRFEEHTRYVRRPRSRSPSPVMSEPPPRAPVRSRVEVRDKVEYEARRPARSPSPHPSRGRSMSRERERIRITQRSISRERIPSPSPSPPPPPVPEVIRGPTIERDVITHYRSIDHGVIQAPRPPPPPSPQPLRPILKSREIEVTRDTDIDITRSRGRTDVDIDIRRRSVSRERGALVHRRRSPSPAAPPARRTFDDIDHRHKLSIDIDERHRSTSVTHEHSHNHGHRRAHSAVPFRDEAERITSKIDSRGRHGEAYGGATRDWTIVDVPPGTERVRMEGAGGGAANVTWERYSGVRRARFIPDRDAESSVSSSNTTTVVSERERERDRVVETNDRVNVSVVDKRHEIDVETRRPSRRSKTDDMWTEITKDLVTREAIEEMGYDYEESGPFFYIMQYLQYEDVLKLVELSEDIRRHRRRHIREIEYEREYRDDHQRRRSSKYSDYDRELVVGVDREVVYERERPPVRGYLR